MKKQINKNLFNNTRLAYISKSNSDLIKSYLIFWSLNNHFFSKIGTALLQFFLKLNFPIKSILKKTIFSQFCGGETLDECNKIVSTLSKHNIFSMPDYSVEGEESEKGFEDNMNKTIQIIDSIGKSKLPFYVVKLTGLISYNSLEKISNDKNSEFSKNEYLKLKNRLEKIILSAIENNISLLIDAEESWIQDSIDSVSLDLMNKYNKKSVFLYLTFQCYKKGTLDRIKNSFQISKKNNFKLGVKLVRGAYMEKERERALKYGYDSPIHDSKNNTDIEFNNSIEFCVKNLTNISMWIGSHNEDSFVRIASLMNKNNIKKDDQRVWFSQLYGMSENISFNLAKLGYNVVILVPFGPIKKTIPYLIRRAKENSSVKGQSSRQFLLVKNEIKRRKILTLI